MNIENIYFGICKYIIELIIVVFKKFCLGSNGLFERENIVYLKF